ncbi:MAG: hypothetical protein ACJZZ8_02805 [Candidatus Neomarinimicrobiota bacterium]
MKRFYFYSYLFTLVIIGCGPELRTVVERDTYNRIILEAELKGEVDTNWVKLHTYHFIGPSTNGPPLETAKEAQSDVSVDDNGNLAWGAEEPSTPEPISAEPPLEDTPPDTGQVVQDFTITVDSTKKTFSSFAKGRKEGEWKTWHANGQLKTYYTYIKDQIEGTYTYYDSIGTTIKTETYKKSILEGITSDFNENSTLRMTTNYKKGLKDGLQKEFIEGVVLIEQRTFKKDSLDGEWTSWHDNGTKKVVRVYKNGVPRGNWLFYDEKGAWMREQQYKKGLADGIWSFYDRDRFKVFHYYTLGELVAEYTEAKWPNGQIKEDPPTFNKEGQLHGTRIGYWANGSTRYTMDYKKGKKDGDEIRYDSTGVLIFEVRYDKGIRNGMEKEYYANGNPKRLARYKDNILDGMEKEYYMNGDPKRLASYKDGKLNGKTELFDSLGVKTETIAYKDSLRSGKTTLWWPNGKAYQRLTYENDILEGKFEEWDSLGTDIVKGSYTDGVRHKKWLYYDSEGRRDKFVFLDMDSIITDYKFKYYPNWQLVEEPGFDDRGLYDGKWESFYIDGATSKKFSYTEGKRDKIWMSYYQDARRENYTFYALDTLITDYDFTYYNNLQIMEEPKFSKDGLFDGKWEQFYEGGETKKTYLYERNQKNKIWMSYYQDARRENYTFYALDTLITDYDFTYYNNLQIMEEPKFSKDGLFDGKWEQFYEDGETKMTFSYDRNNKDQIWMSYFPDNRRQNYTFYNQDTLITNYDFKYYDNIKIVDNPDYYDYEYYMNLQIVEKPRYDNLQIIEEPEFDKNGLYDGKWESFFENGDPWRTFFYEEGLKVKLWSVFFDSTGVRHSETNYENDLRHGQYQEWYENIIVRPKEEGLYKEGVKDLLWSYWNEFQEKRFEEWRDGILYDSFEYEYYPNGQVKEEPSYKDRRKHGDWVRYFPNGDIMGTRTFKVGLKEGLWIEYYKNPPGDRDDIIAWKGKYVADKKEGKWEWFWLNQEKQRVDNYKKGEMTSEKCFERDGSGQTRDCSEVRYESSR